ncbi:hypothetical protein SLUN_16660 [Streptomyces lunaelactis]|uniref:Integrase catalytic domain-containing protein n=1 Tax=Streptomyces lunaelactis TaxID=1535768 RepID=A0A2R4T344_9ACTN|nr:hypothetical protein SLUN_16660 [Streptomyces lunaelactis]NUK84233.1 DDE-type integrase/transposase/recombinase [Streptomyces lunaelactis]
MSSARERDVPLPGYGHRHHFAASGRLGARRPIAGRAGRRCPGGGRADPGQLTGAIIHTDHCAQHTSAAFATACVKASVRQSMSTVGSSADNALAESFNATFKRETL